MFWASSAPTIYEATPLSPRSRTGLLCIPIRPVPCHHILDNVKGNAGGSEFRGRNSLVYLLTAEPVLGIHPVKHPDGLVNKEPCWFESRIILCRLELYAFELCEYLYGFDTYQFEDIQRKHFQGIARRRMKWGQGCE